MRAYKTHLYLITLTILVLSLLISSHCSVQTAWADLAGAKAAYNEGDYATAFQEFSKLAEEGNAEAQYSLGVMYDRGEGIPQDYAEAIKWYRIAANQGDVLAQYNLGIMCRDGKGVPQDYVEAAKWYRKAADKGLAPAQFNLGLMYLNGEGVSRDYVQAYMWFNLSTAQGFETAEKNRDILAEKMTPEQVTEAQRLSREWKPKKEGEGAVREFGNGELRGVEEK